MTDYKKNLLAPIDIEEVAVFDPPEGYKGYFPPSAKAMYGCINCSWRGTDQCPYKFDGGVIQQRNHPIWKRLKFPMNAKVDGICSYKKNYLVLMSGEWDTLPSYDLWQSRLNKNEGIVQREIDKTRYKHWSTELAKVESDPGQYDSKHVKMVKKEYEDSRQNYIQVWQLVGNFLEKGVDRETAKKIDMNLTKKNIPHEQILEIMRGDYKVVDADFKIVKDDSKSVK